MLWVIIILCVISILPLYLTWSWVIDTIRQRRKETRMVVQTMAYLRDVTSDARPPRPADFVDDSTLHNPSLCPPVSELVAFDAMPSQPAGQYAGNPYEVFLLVDPVPALS